MLYTIIDIMNFSYSIYYIYYITHYILAKAYIIYNNIYYIQ